LDEGAAALARKTNWLNYGCPDSVGTLKLVLAIMTHPEQRIFLVNSKGLTSFLIQLTSEDDPRFLTYFSAILKNLPISRGREKEFLERLSKDGALRALFEASLEFDNDIAIHAALNVLSYCGEIGYSPEYLMMADKLKQIIVKEKPNAGDAIEVITLLSRYPLCAKKFRDLKLGKLFKELLKDHDYKDCAKIFLENMDGLKYY